jgi:hypothetical protein
MLFDLEEYASGYIDKSIVYSLITKKDTFNGNINTVNDGYIIRTLNGVQTIYGAASATYSRVGAGGTDYIILARFDTTEVPVDSLISIKARYTAFEILQNPNTLAYNPYVFSEDRYANFVKTASGTSFITGTVSGSITNMTGPVMPGTSMGHSDPYLSIVAINPNTTSSSVYGNRAYLRWTVNFEYSVSTNPSRVGSISLYE